MESEVAVYETAITGRGAAMRGQRVQFRKAKAVWVAWQRMRRSNAINNRQNAYQEPANGEDSVCRSWRPGLLRQALIRDSNPLGHIRPSSFEMDQVDQAMQGATSSQTYGSGSFSLESWSTRHHNSPVSEVFRATGGFGLLRRHCEG